MSDQLFIKIDNPRTFRKALLESLKQTIHGLKGFEKVNQVRFEKIKKITELKKCMREITSLTNQLHKALPELHDIPKSKSGHGHPLPHSASQPKSSKASSSQSNELHELESQLQDVEEKLKILE
jgi:hypothetical protein